MEEENIERERERGRKKHINKEKTVGRVTERNKGKEMDTAYSYCSRKSNSKYFSGFL
jgi:hypothetical protein